jgi:hypothetical protein
MTWGTTERVAQLGYDWDDRHPIRDQRAERCELV